MTTQTWTQDPNSPDIRKALQEIRLHGLNNLFCHPDYVAINGTQTETPTFFLYNENGEVFLKSFLLRSIPDTNYYDITNAYGFGGALTNSTNQTFIERALNYFFELANKNSAVAELLKVNPYENTLFQSLPTTIYKTSVMRKLVSIPLSNHSEMDIQKKYTHANRKNIRKSETYGFCYNIDNSDISWKNFTYLYEATMKANKAIDFYYFSESYFIDIEKNLPGNYFLINLIDNEETIASLLIFHDDNNGYCHLLGNNPAFFQYGINNYIYHLAILECKKIGLNNLLLGGGRSNSTDDSLLKYKMNFSDNLIDFIVGERIINKSAYQRLCEAKGKKAYTEGNLFCYRD